MHIFVNVLRKTIYNTFYLTVSEQWNGKVTIQNIIKLETPV